MNEQTTEHLNDRNGGPTFEPYSTPGDGLTTIPDVKVRLLSDDARMPERGSFHAAGWDLYAAESHNYAPGEIYALPLGFSTEIPTHLHGRIESRSGMACKGMVVLTGVIDADYRGEWKVILMNVTPDYVNVAKGDRVAQVVFRPTVPVALTGSSELSDSARGAGGFGSTGAR